MSNAMPGANLYVADRLSSVPRYLESPEGRPFEKFGNRPADGMSVLSVSTLRWVQAGVTPAPNVNVGVIAYATLRPACIRPYLS